MYRYTDVPNSFASEFKLPMAEIKLLEFSIYKETPKGWWIVDYHDDNISELHLLYLGSRKKWVSKDGRKRFAYPTKEEALFSYLKRKEKQVKILRHRLDMAESALNQAKKIKL